MIELMIGGKRFYGEPMDFRVERSGQWTRLRLANGDSVRVKAIENIVYRVYDENRKPVYDSHGEPEYHVECSVYSIGSDLL